MKKIGLFLFCFFMASVVAFSQVGINTETPKANTDLTLGSTDKGFLPNKVTLRGETDTYPLAGVVDNGTIVYHVPSTTVTGSQDLGEGLFYWAGDKWVRFTTTTAQQQDSRMLDFKKTGDVGGNTPGDEVILPYVSEAQSNAGNIGTELPNLATNFTVDKPGTIYVNAVLYAKLMITSTIKYAYVGNTFFTVRVTNTADNTFHDFIAGCSPISTANGGENVGANNNPAVAVAQGGVRVLPDVIYDVKVYALEGWVTSSQGYITAGTYMWRTFKLYSTLKIDYVSDPY